jgi:protein-tyrosine-phosphatase
MSHHPWSIGSDSLRSRVFTPNRQIWWFALGYCVSYVPYAALTKATSDGLLSGKRGGVSALEFLPTVLAGCAIVMPLIITLVGWWRYAGQRRFVGVNVPWPGRQTALSGLCFAAIIATTTLAYMFRGVSIVLALLLMRGGVLTLAPIVDVVCRRQVHWYSWTAFALSLTAVGTALSTVNSDDITTGVVLNLSVYLSAYAVRLRTMTTVAKADAVTANRRYFVEENLVCVMVLVPAAALLSWIGAGEASTPLQNGFVSLPARDVLMPALATGGAYACLAVFGTCVYLDRRENTFAVALNRAASLISGVVAALLLSALAGPDTVSVLQLLSVALMLLAIVVLTAPAWRVSQPAAGGVVPVVRRLFVFVCSGNTSRSPMAQAICSAEIAKRLGIPIQALDLSPVQAVSAGLTAVPGAPMTREAQHALQAVGVPVFQHASRNLTDDVAERAEAIFCMTSGQHQMLVSQFPAARQKIHCLQPGADLEDPSGRGPDVYVRLARQLQMLIGQRLDDLGIAAASPAV